MSLERRRRAVIPPDINVTPLVDVVLVLLIIFMVVTPQMEQDVQVDLPGIFNPDPEVEGVLDPLKLTVVKKGEYYVEKDRLDLDQAIERLSLEHAAEPTRRLLLKADAKLTYGDVREIFSRAQGVGFPGMALMVGERYREGKVGMRDDFSEAEGESPAEPGAGRDAGSGAGPQAAGS